MTARKAERLLNLVILLLVARTYTTKEQIRELMEPYRATPSSEAFERMFERDKEELRALGIPLETGGVDRYFDDERGYRIARDAFELPSLDFTADEVAVLGLAARVWRHAGLASATSEAVLKLKAAGVAVDPDQIDAVQPALGSQDPSFEAMCQATLSRTPVRFDYRRGDQAVPETRHVQPWGVITAQGRWYVAGFDLDRGGPRVFRLSRVVSEVVEEGPPGSYSVPEGTDLRALSQSLVPPSLDHQATVRARTGAANGLRRHARLLHEGVAGPDGTTDWDSLEVTYGYVDRLAEELLGYGDAVVVDAPAAAREAVVRRLRALADGAEDAA